MATSTSIYTQWEIGKVYSFSSVVPALLPDTYQRLRLSSESSYEDAKLMAGTDIYSMWRKLYPHLPNGTPDTPSMSKWFIFRNEENEVVAMAEQWIDGSTVVVNDFINYSILVTDSNYTQMLRVRDILSQIGLKFQIIEPTTLNP